MRSALDHLSFLLSSEVTDSIESILLEAESGSTANDTEDDSSSARCHDLAAAFCRQAERGDAQKLRQMLDALPVGA